MFSTGHAAGEHDRESHSETLASVPIMSTIPPQPPSPDRPVGELEREHDDDKEEGSSNRASGASQRSGLGAGVPLPPPPPPSPPRATNTNILREDESQQRQRQHLIPPPPPPTLQIDAPPASADRDRERMQRPFSIRRRNVPPPRSESPGSMEKELIDEPAMSASGRELEIGLNRRPTSMRREDTTGNLSADQRRRMSRRANDLSWIVPEVSFVLSYHKTFVFIFDTIVRSQVC